MKLLHSSCLVLAACPLAGQQIWRVNNQGSPGAHFADIPAAVAAASPGDEIRVFTDSGLPISGLRYHAVVVNKPLRIMGVLVGPGGPGVIPIAVYGTWVISGIQQGQSVELHGLSNGHDNYPQTGIPGGVIITDCQGSVLLDSVDLAGGGGPDTIGRIERCANVVLRGCAMWMSGDPMRIIDSQVLVTTTGIRYAAPLTGMSTPYPITTEAMRITNSTVTLVGSVIRGASDYPLGWPYISRPGVVIESGMLRAGPASFVQGGSTSSGSQRGLWVLNPSIGSVLADPRASIANPFPATSVVPETQHATYHSWVVANENFGVTVAGPANGFALIAFGDWLPNTPSPLGPLAMDPTSVLPIELVALPAPNGYYQWTLNCPMNAPISHAYALQALTIAPSGALAVTLPSPLTVAWPRGPIP